MDIKTKIAILGAGRSGIGAAVLAKKHDYEVFVSDFSPIAPEFKQQLIALGIPFEEGKHSFEHILLADEIIKSPGIPDKAPIVMAALDKNIPVISEIEFAYRFTQATIIAITGSNGKTTTTNLVFDILKNAGFNVGMAGNVGDSFALSVANDDFDYYVLELSSFQLDGIRDFRPNVAILLNVTPDHLDRYNYQFDNYLRSKFRIAMNQDETDYFIYNIDDEAIVKYIQENAIKSQLLSFSIQEKNQVHAFVDEQELRIFGKDELLSIGANELSLKGKHNIYNSMAAAVSAQVLDIRNEIIRQSLTNFKGIEHRLEPVLFIRDVLFINDSKATNVNSTWYALESMNNATVWIAGGIDKGNDYNTLRELVRKKVKALVCLGLDNQKLIDAFSDIVPCYEARTMKDAVNGAFLLANKGETVLLSPACASFDLFMNYEDRGRQFKDFVRKL